MKIVYLGLMCMSILSFADYKTEPSVKQVWELSESILAPESVCLDEKREVLYVSNINGEGTEKDQNGYISKIDFNGKLLQSKWVEGLNAPKGMRIFGDTLYVTDIDEVVSIDLNQSKIKKKLSIKGAQFLNDIAINEDGVLFVSDTIVGKIFKIVNMNAVTTFLSGKTLEGPNGLFIQNGELYVSTWGVPKKDWSTVTPGRLISFNLKNKKKSIYQKKPFGHLDGLEFEQGSAFLATDWVAGQLLRVSKDGIIKELATGLKGSADLAYIKAEKLAIIPQMGANRVTAFKVEWE